MVPVLAIASIAAEVFPLAVKVIDKLFGGGKGAIKKNAAVAVVEGVLDHIRAEDPSVSIPTGQEIPSLVQSTVDFLNAKGELTGTSTVIDSSSPDAEYIAGGFLIMEGALRIVKASQAAKK